MKRILIIQGHPNRDSLSEEILENYKSAAERAGAEVRTIILRELQFNPILFKGYKRTDALEPDIFSAQEDISWAEHLVFIYPNWWGTYPALLKGFLDKVLWPGFAFRYRRTSRHHDKMLKGKSVRIFFTMDSAFWYYWLVQGSPGHKAIKRATLRFCGFSPVRVTSFPRAREVSKARLNLWMKKVQKFGRKTK